MTLGGGEVLEELRGIQVLLLALVLMGACAAKLRRAISARNVEAAVSPMVLFPVRLRRPGAIALCAAELFLGIALVLTAGPFPGGPAATGTLAAYVRGGTALAFLLAVGALHELRGRRPDAGCGCFGDLSHTPVGWRPIARAALLSAAALASVSAQPLRMPRSAGTAWVLLAMVAAELAVLAALSPELGELMVRLGYSEPCEVRRIPVSRTLASLRASSPWRRYQRHLTALEPSDVWREGCWRYAVFPGITQGRRVDIVFAVYTKSRRPPVRAAIVDAATDESLGGLAIPPPRVAPDGGTTPLPVFVQGSGSTLYRSIRQTQ